MKIAVYGLWHLGCVTAACLAEQGFEVVGIDPSPDTVAGLRAGKAPLHEPGLNELLLSGLRAGQLRFSTDLQSAADADVVWVTFDTPVLDDDSADVASVKNAITALLPVLRRTCVVLISSQLPVGSARSLFEDDARTHPASPLNYAVSPENLRLGKALDSFKHADRTVVGISCDGARAVLEPVVTPFAGTVLWTSIESAEMVKHALNAFLAVSVTFINEIAALCEATGADAKDVEIALRLEPRVGAKAYMRPGGPFAGGTLGRDVTFLTDLSRQTSIATPLLSSVFSSNRAHLSWPVRRLESKFGSLEGRRIAVLGLAYTVGTDTLRRSAAVETCLSLRDKGANVSAFDPAINALPENLAGAFALSVSVADAIADADAAIIATAWPEFLEVESALWLSSMRTPVILDADRFLEKTMRNEPRIEYITVGRP